MPPHNAIAVGMPASGSPSFSNATQVTVSDDSVVLQFAYVRPDTTQGTVIAEIVLSPKHAIDFSKSLDKTIKQHFMRHLDAR